MTLPGVRGKTESVRPLPNEPLKVAKTLGVIALVALTALPIIRIAYLIATTGGNNLSVDFVYWVPAVDRILKGTFEWEYFFRDVTHSSTHINAFPVLLHVGIARFGLWNTYFVLYVGLALAVSKMFLLYDVLTYQIEHWTKLLIWPALSALVFSVSQSDVFLFGLTTTNIGLGHLGFVLGIWGLVRFPNHWRGVAVMIVGGIVASWSFGAGVYAWPLYLPGMVLLGFRQRKYYMGWAAGTAIAAAPFIQVFNPNQAPSFSIANLLNLGQAINAVGLPLTKTLSVELATGSSVSEAGIIGVVLGMSGIAMLWMARSPGAIARAAPSLMLILHALLSIVTVILFRGNIVTWYTMPFMLYWIGLLGLLPVLLVARAGEDTKPTIPKAALKDNVTIWSTAFIATLIVLYGASNLTVYDKLNLARTRTPVSTACLRHYRDSPLHCAGHLFTWRGASRTQMLVLGEPLERHHLSVFAARQQWTLQGDFIFDTVRLSETPGAPDIYWSPNRSTEQLPWHDFRHLNLVLHAPNAIDWTVRLPQNLNRAEFRSAVAISTSARNEPTADGIVAEIYVDREGWASRRVYSQELSPTQHRWQPIRIPLDEYAGETITVRLTTRPGDNTIGDWAIYRYPRINLALDAKHIDSETPATNAPLPLAVIPAPSADDYVFDLADESLWTPRNIERIPSETGDGTEWLAGRDPQLDLDEPLNLCLADYSHIYIRMAASVKNIDRRPQVYYKLDGQDSFHRDRSAIMIVNEDEEMDTYVYDLKLLELEQSARLVDIRLDPVIDGTQSSDGWVSIADFRLIRDEGPTGCE